jgi:tetratricopeptide (TPR) repeat protein
MQVYDFQSFNDKFMRKVKFMQNTSTTDNTIGAEIDVTLHKTDFGDFVFKHKNSFIGALIVLFVAALAYGFYYNYQKSQVIARAAEVEIIQTKTIDPFLKDPTKVDILMSDLAKIDSAILASGAFKIYAAELVQKMLDTGLNKEAATFLKSIVDVSNKTEYLTHMFAHQLVVAYENSGELALAETVLNDLLNSGKKFMQDKLYFDLARISSALNKKEQAVKNYQFILEQFPKSQYREYAEIMLQDLK